MKGGLYHVFLYCMPFVLVFEILDAAVGAVAACCACVDCSFVEAGCVCALKRVGLLGILAEQIINLFCFELEGQRCKNQIKKYRNLSSQVPRTYLVFVCCLLG